MNQVKYLWILCALIIVFAFSIKNLYKKYELELEHRQQQTINSYKPIVESPLKMDNNILIDDSEKKIEIKKTKPTVIKPYVTAESYIVANLVTGERYIENNPNLISPIASVSKLYTALVVHHLFDPKTKIKITQSDLDTYGNSGNLMLDEEFDLDQLLHIMLMESSNDAAEAFAQSYGKSTSTKEFIDEMNGFANEIGMNKTYFDDPSGLSPNNISTANDLLNLVKYLYKSEPDILKISKTVQYDLATTTEHGAHHVVNINPFSMNGDFIGGKTGRTDAAKEAMVSLFNKKINNIDYPIAIIILRSEFGEREMNTKKLLELFEKKISGV